MEDFKENKEAFMDRAVGASVRIGFVLILFVLSYWILKPFIAPLVWGVVFAVGIYPLHRKLSGLLGGKQKLSATIIVLFGLAIIIVPVVMFATSTVDGISDVVNSAQEGTLEIPPPNESVKDWPVIGNKTHELWSQANSNLNGFILKYNEQFMAVLSKISSAIMGGIGSIFLFILAMIISGVLLLQAESGKKASEKVFNVLVGNRGEELTNLSMLTIRSVVQGVIGIAVIQTLFLSIGMFAIKLPAAGILSIIVLIVAIVQLPPILVMLPIIIYVFSFANTTPAIIFTVWAIFWSAADTFLKPMMLGKGVDVPMLVVLLGAIGGMMLGGPVGLFVGAVVLALTYKIFDAMLNEQ